MFSGVRVTNVFVPIFYKKIIDKIAETGMLESKIFSYLKNVDICNCEMWIRKSVYNEANISGAGTNAKDWPWDMVSIWMVLKLLQGSGTGGQGLLNNWRSLLWIKVKTFFL